jgi:LPXTG-motif cell wall-anchored protein
MKRKVLSLIGFVAILVSIITISWNQKAYALENNESSVTTRFVDYDNLNSLEQNQVKQGKIDDIVQHDNETFTLVYKKVVPKSEVIPPSSSKTPTSSSVISSNVESTNSSLPKTGEKSGKLLPVVGIFIALAASFLLYKSKRVKNLILLLLAAGSIGGINKASAETVGSLPDTKVTTYSFGNVYSEEIPEVSGYEYMGYIHEFKDNPKPIEKGNITVQFLDEQGKELAASETLTGDIGTEYKTSPKNVDGYTLIDTPSNATGKFESTTQTVKYIYKTIDQSATIVVRFVDESGKEFSIPDLTNKGYIKVYKPEGIVPVTDDEISKYTVELDYNNQNYKQGENVEDVIIPAKVGEKYSLPEMVRFVMKDEVGNTVRALYALNPDNSMSGPSDWRTYDSPVNSSGTVDSKEVVVTYVIKRYGAMIPAP